MANVVLIGTLDTKRDEYGWLRNELHAAGASTTLIDVGTFSEGAGIADVRSSEVAAAAGHDLGRLRADDHRGAAMTAMSEGAAVVVTRLFERGELHAVLAVGGSSGSAVAGTAVQALPVGVPKLLVTTMAAGDVRPSSTPRTSLSCPRWWTSPASTTSTSGCSTPGARLGAGLRLGARNGPVVRLDDPDYGDTGSTEGQLNPPACDPSAAPSPEVGLRCVCPGLHLWLR